MKLSILDRHLHISFTPWEKLCGMHRNFSIPLSHIKEVHHTFPKTSWRELRMPGCFVPWVIKAGSYYTPRGWEYWFVTRLKKFPLILELRDEKYKRLVLGFEGQNEIPNIDLQ